MNSYRTKTDDTLRETVHHGDSGYPFAYYYEDIWEYDFHCIDWHWHHELEFVYAEKGTASCFIGSEKIQLHKGCGLFINSGILHRFEAKSSTVIPNIVFSPVLLAPEECLIYRKYIQPVIQSAVSFLVFDPQTDWQNQILHTLSDIFSLQKAGKNKELRTVKALLKIWNILFSHINLSSDMSGMPHLNHHQAQLQIMMQYIQAHYAEDLSLEGIAKSASISKSGALHIFQSGIHASPVAYLIQYRLARAAERLRTTEEPVSLIAEETGFTSAGYFCRKFRQFYDATPNAYRRKNTGQEPSSCLSRFTRLSSF